MSKKVKSKNGADYNLNKAFTAQGSEYSTNAASSLAAWVRFTSGVPTDLGPHLLVCAYEGAESTSTSQVGSVTRNIASFSDSSSTNARIDPVNGELSMTSGTSETPGAGTSSTDIPFSISTWAKRGSISGTDYLWGKQGGKQHAYITSLGQVVFKLAGNSVGDAQIYYADLSDFALSTTSFDHLVFTYDGRGGTSAYLGMKFYANGNEIPLGTASGAYTFGTYDGADYDADGPLYIGAAYQAGIVEFTGDMSEFSVWRNYELTSAEVRAIYKGSSSGITRQYEEISGVISLPTRIQLRELDRLSGKNPVNISSGGPDFLNGSSLPFDDTNTVTYLSSFAQAKIKFIDPVVDGDYIDVTGSNGSAHRIKFVNDIGSTSYSPTDTAIDLYDYKSDPPKYLGDPKNIAPLVAKKIAAQKNLDMSVSIETKAIEKFDIDGKFLKNPKKSEIVTLKHKKPSIGTYAKGNVINVGRSSPTIPSPIVVEQFSAGLDSGINYSALLSNDGFAIQPSRVVATPNLLPTIRTSGSIIRGLSDVGYKEKTNFNLSPFNEHRVEVRNNSEFDSFGTHKTVLEGFGSPLKSKTNFVLELNSKNTDGDPIFFATGSAQGTYWPALANTSGSGMAYWNLLENKWEQLDVGTIQNPGFTNETSDPFSAEASTRSQSCLGFSLVSSSTLAYPPYADTKFRAASTGESYSSHNLKVVQTGKGFSSPVTQYSFPWGIQYNATGSQEVKLSSYINSPFLLEKMRIEVEGSFGVGTSTEFSVQDYPRTKVLFILNQTTNGDSPHISGTIASSQKSSNNGGSLQTENTSVPKVGTRELVSWAKLGFVRQDSNLISSTDALIVAQSDFDNLHTFESSETSPHVTASISFNLTPKLGLSTDISSIHPKRQGTSEAQRRQAVGLIVGNSHGGANLLGDVSGRQIASSLGSSTRLPTGSFIDNTSNTPFENIFSKQESHRVSPYLLYPTDRLIIGWQNIDMRTSGSNDAGALGEQIVADQFADKIKKAKITFYGSHIRLSRECHYNINQNLSTNEVYESILGEPVIDQFDVEPVTNLSGSTFDSLFFGSMTAPDLEGVRGRRASIAKGEAGPTGSLTRAISYSNDIVKYKDSQAPPISHILKDTTIFPETTTLNQSIAVGGTVYSALILSNNPASASFKMSKKIGLFNSKDFVAQTIVDIPSSPLVTPGGGPVTSAKNLAFDMSTDPAAEASYKIYGGTSEHVKGINSFGSPEIAKPGISTPVSLKGGSAKEIAYMQSIFWAAPTPAPGKNMFAVIKTSNFKVLPFIKCWKYGFWSGIPQSPKTYFRRKTYGQFRDLIQQAPETFTTNLYDEDSEKFIYGWKENGGPVKVDFYSRNGVKDIDPLDTNTQNLSSFATSSLPYYDGIAVERDIFNNPPPDHTDKTSISEGIEAIIDGDA